MRNAIFRFFRRLGNEGAIENARRDADELMRTLAAIDALAVRVSARGAVLDRAA